MRYLTVRRFLCARWAHVEAILLENADVVFQK